MSEPVQRATAWAPAGGHSTVEELLRERIFTAVGGWRGAAEGALPTIAFVAVWTWRSDLRQAVIASVVALVVLGALRLLRHETLRYLAGSVLVVIVSAVIALRTGKAEAAFLPSMLTAGATGLLFLVTTLLRWPVFGFLIAAGDPALVDTSERMRGYEPDEDADPQDEDARAKEELRELGQLLTSWRRDRGIVTVASRLGWVMVALEAVRLLVEIPLYLAGRVELLGLAKIVLGWPLYALALLVMGLILARGHTPLAPRD